MEVVSPPSPPYGAIMLTFLFVIVGLVIEYVNHSSSDGVPGLMKWATSFSLAIITAFMAIHMYIISTTKLGTFAFLTLSVGYVLQGFASLYFENHGAVDEDGDAIGNRIYYYLLTFFYFTLWTVSASLIGFFFRGTWDDLHYISMGTKSSNVCRALLYLALFFLTIGCIWAGFFSSSDVGENVFDQVSSESERRDKLALHYLQICEWIWYTLYLLFFMLIASVMRPLLVAIRQEADIIVWGLSSVRAADGVFLFQMIGIALLILYWVAYAETFTIDDTGMDILLFAFNYVMLMTIFFLHNIVFTMSYIVFDDSDDDESDLEEQHEGKATTNEVPGDTEEDTSDDEMKNTPMNRAVGRSETMEVGTVVQGGAEIVLSDLPLPSSNMEELPSPGPGGIRAFLRMSSLASKRKEVTRIRSSKLNLPLYHGSSFLSEDSLDNSLKSGHPAEHESIICSPASFDGVSVRSSNRTQAEI